MVCRLSLCCPEQALYPNCCQRLHFSLPFELNVERSPMWEGLFQPMHLLLIFGIALLVFGPKKLPELGKGIGDAVRGFKSAMNADEEKSVVKTPAPTSDYPASKE
jgi:sec-independent protein translocase protein TatA